MERIHANTSKEVSKGTCKYRDRIELLRNRVDLLTGKDKVLMTMYLENGNSFAQIAKLTGVYPSTIGRRVNRMIKRLTDSEYITCLRNREAFTKLELEIARDYFLRCMTMRKIMHARKLTYYQVRERIRKIRLLVQAIRKAEKRNLRRRTVEQVSR